MKENIINNLDFCTDILEKKYGNKNLWKEFLISLAENEKNIDNMEFQIFDLLVDAVGLDNFIQAIDVLSEKIENLPKEKIYKKLLKVVEIEVEEKNNVIFELKEILSELATPMIRIWDKIALCPLIGTLDSERAQSMAEKLLDFVSKTRSKYVIIDVTGVTYIDTVVGGFLIEIFNAVKLLGTDVIMTGIKPEIAQTLVKLGLDFNRIIIKRDLESGLKYAITKIDNK